MLSRYSIIGQMPKTPADETSSASVAISNQKLENGGA
jgi:hypothetical protein